MFTSLKVSFHQTAYREMYEVLPNCETQDSADKINRETEMTHETDILHELLKDSYPVTGFLKFPVPDCKRSEILKGLTSLEPTVAFSEDIAELNYISGNNLLVVNVLDCEKGKQSAIQQIIWGEIRKHLEKHTSINEETILQFFIAWSHEEIQLFAHIFGIYLTMVNSDSHDSFLLMSSWITDDHKIARKAFKILMKRSMLPSNLSYHDYQLVRELNCETLNMDSEEESSSDHDNHQEAVFSDPGTTSVQRSIRSRLSRRERNQRHAEFLGIPPVPGKIPETEIDSQKMYEFLKKLIAESSRLVTESEFIGPDKFGNQAELLREQVESAENVVLRTFHSSDEQVSADLTRARSIMLELQTLDCCWKQFQQVLENSYKKINRYRFILQEVKAKGRRDPEDVRRDVQVITDLQSLSVLENSIRRLSDLAQEMKIVKRAYDDLKKLDEEALETDELLEEQLKIMEQQVFLFEEPSDNLQPLADQEDTMSRGKFGRQKKKYMVRILKSSVMVRIGGGWQHLDAFLTKHDPCQVAARRLELENSATQYAEIPARRKRQPRSRSSFR